MSRVMRSLCRDLFLPIAVLLKRGMRLDNCCPRALCALGQAVLDLLQPQPGERILDLGCGDGTLTEWPVGLGAEVVGIDNSPAMIAAARQRGLDARMMDARSLSFENEFDAVFSNAALHWVKDDPDAPVAGAAPSGQTPIIAVTADVQEDHGAALRAAGFQAWLIKPIDHLSLLAAVATATAGLAPATAEWDPPPMGAPTGQRAETPIPAMPMGTPLPGTPLPETPMPGMPTPGTPMRGTPTPGVPMRGTPLPDRPLPDMPFPDRPSGRHSRTSPSRTGQSRP